MFSIGIAFSATSCVTLPAPSNTDPNKLKPATTGIISGPRASNAGAAVCSPLPSILMPLVVAPTLADASANPASRLLPLLIIASAFLPKPLRTLPAICMAGPNLAKCSARELAPLAAAFCPSTNFATVFWASGPIWLAAFLKLSAKLSSSNLASTFVSLPAFTSSFTRLTSALYSR